jgi:hypothetical protein
MASVRNSTYSIHSLADEHLLGMMNEKDNNIVGSTTQTLTVSTPFSTKLLQTIFLVSGPSCHKHEEATILEDEISAPSFNDRQKSIQVVGLAIPEKSKSNWKRSPEKEHIIDNGDGAVSTTSGSHRGVNYSSEPQMRYIAPEQGIASYTTGYRQQGCGRGYRHPIVCYSRPYGRSSYYGYGGGYGCPQRPVQAYFQGGTRQRRYGGGYYYGGGGCGYGRGGNPGYGSYCVQRPVLVQRHDESCCCCF